MPSKPADTVPYGRDDFDTEDSNRSGNPHFSEILQARLSRRQILGGGLGVAVTAGLFSQPVLARRNLMPRKGFPDSYDRRALLRFVSEVKAGKAEVRAPVYSHLVYDIVPQEQIVVRRPDVLIVEGLNVLQPPRAHDNGRAGLAVSDFFDFSVYVDAHVGDIKRWYVDRFLELRQTAFADPDSHFHRYATLTDDAAVDIAGNIWDTINAPNLVDNILPTRSRATLVLTKGRDHAVERVRLRKL